MRNTIIDHNTCMHKECLRNCRVGAKRFGPVFYVGSLDFWSTLFSCGVPNALGIFFQRQTPFRYHHHQWKSVHYAPFLDTGHAAPAMTASTSWISRGHFVKFSQPSAVTTCSGMEKIRPPLCSCSTVTKNYSQVMSFQRCMSHFSGINLIVIILWDATGRSVEFFLQKAMVKSIP